MSTNNKPFELQASDNLKILASIALDASQPDTNGVRRIRLAVAMKQGDIVSSLTKFLENPQSDTRQMLKTIQMVDAAQAGLRGLIDGFESAEAARAGIDAIRAIAPKADDQNPTIEQSAIATFLDGNQAFLDFSQLVNAAQSKTGAQMSVEGDKKQGGGISFGSGYRDRAPLHSRELKDHTFGSESSA